MKLIIWSLLLPICASVEILCPSNMFWSNRLTKCIDCSKCRKGHVAVRPCQPHKDTECGPLSDLNIDWSWMPKEKTHFLQRKRIHFIDDEDKQLEEKKILGHIDKDILASIRKKYHEGNTKENFQDFGTQFPTQKLEKHRKHKKHFEFPSILEEEKPESKRQRKNSKFLKFPEDSFPSHKWEFEGSDESRKHLRFDDEKELERWLLMSQKKLLHRKADLMKTLKEGHSSSDFSEEGIKLNHPIHKLDAKLYQDLLDHESHSNKTKHQGKQKQPRDFDLKVFQDLIKEEKDMDFMSVLSKGSESQSQDFKSVIPSHRLFLGEPSTVSELIGQAKDSQEIVKGEINKNPDADHQHTSKVTILEEHREVVSIPFTTAETFVWDWQAILFSAAGVSCLLFVVAVIYTILNAHQWRKVKIKYETDIEEMSSKLALMPSNFENSVVEVSGTGRYLEQLLATQNLDDRKGNIYINDKPMS